MAGVDPQCKENGPGHHTDQYAVMKEEKALVVRRGASFTLGIRFKDRPFDINRDRLKIVLKTGDGDW